MINFGLGTLGPGMLLGILGVGLRTLLRTFGLRPTTSEAAPSAKAETLAKPREEASSSSGAATLPVSAVTLEGPPGLSAPKAKPKAKASISPSTLLMSAVVLGNFGFGNTFRVDGMTDGVVDFSFGGFRECENFEPTAYMAPLETFSLNGRTDENQRLFSVGDLGDFQGCCFGGAFDCFYFGGFRALDIFRLGCCDPLLSEGLCF